MLLQACKSVPRTGIQKCKYAITNCQLTAFCVGTKDVTRTLWKKENDRIISQHHRIPKSAEPGERTPFARSPMPYFRFP